MQKNSILGGALLLTGANLLLRLVSIVFNVFLSQRIGASGLGLLQLISTVGVFAGLVGSSGVRIAAMCLSAEEFGRRRLGGVRAAVSTCLGYGLLVSSAAGVLLFFFAKPIAQHLLADERASLSLCVMGLLLPFSCLSGIMSGYCTACGRIRQLVIIQIAERLASLLLTAALLLTWAKEDLSRSCCAIVLGSSLGSIFDFVLLYFLYRRDMHQVNTPKEPLQMRKRLLHLCIPLALNDYLRAGLNTAEQLLIPFGLAKYGGSGEAALASYGVIHAMVFPVLMFPAAILYSMSDLLVPELSRSRAMGRKLRIVDVTDKCLRMTLLFACAVSGVFFCCAKSLGLLIYDNYEAGRYLKFFAPIVLMLYLDAITDGMLKGMAEQISCVRYNTLTSFFDVALLFLLLPKWGIGGYLFSFTLTHAINLLLSLRRLLQVTGHRPALSQLLRPVFCLLPALMVTMLLPEGLLRGVFLLVLFFPLCLLSDALTGKDLRWLRKVFQRKKGVSHSHPQ